MVVACWWLAPWKQLAPQWQAATVRGQQHLMKIADAIQKTTYLNEDDWGPLADATQLHDQASGRLWELAHKCSKRLETEIEVLGDVYAQMRQLLDDVDQFQRHDDATRYRYESLLLEVLGMYERELVAKSMIAADMFDCRSHDTMTVYIASWQMQPHVDVARLEEIDQLLQTDLQ